MSIFKDVRIKSRNEGNSCRHSITVLFSILGGSISGPRLLIQLMFLFDGLDDSYYFDTGYALCFLFVLLIKLMEKETVLAIDDLLFIVLR